jgi:hypothetical protein
MVPTAREVRLDLVHCIQLQFVRPFPNSREIAMGTVEVSELLGVLLPTDRTFARFQLLLRSLLPKGLLPAVRDCVEYRVRGGEMGPE